MDEFNSKLNTAEEKIINQKINQKKMSRLQLEETKVWKEQKRHGGYS